MDGEVREATWRSQAKSEWVPLSSSGTVPTELFFSLAIIGPHQQAGFFPQVWALETAE